jgi:all-trans-nonaprenyl-diphosphate synthase
LFAQSSWYLANLDNLDVVKLLSQVIMDLAEGEIQQGLKSLCDQSVN